jgi:serine phosphatase RsbU (regulator of sigma subunit)/anti-sigma regulatory factor (Ser/Thr protein kinase)
MRGDVQEPDERVATATYAPEPAAAAQARRFVRETLRSWGIPGPAPQVSSLVDDAVLLTSELVTNAVVHAGTQVMLTCRMRNKAVEVAVRDRHPARSLITSRQSPGDAGERTSGRGLMLPSALATSWGVTYARTAKSVWFRIGFADYPADAIQACDAPSPDALFTDVRPAGRNGTQSAILPGPIGSEPDDLLFEGVTTVVSEPGAHRLDIGKLGYDELLRHTVETARDAVDADAAYALVADEDGELRMRAAAGLGPPAVLDALAGHASQAADIASRSVMTVPFLVEGRVTGILAAASGQPDRFAEGDSARLQRVADRMALSLERARLGELERARRGRVSFLAEASDLLAGTLDQEKIIALAAQLVVPRLATWCAVLLADDTGSSHPAYVWHADESRLDALGKLLDTVPVPDVPARGGGRSWSLAVDDLDGLPPDAVELAADSAWCFPLAARGRSLGILTIGRSRGGGLPREVTELAEDLARRTALALDNAQLYERQQETSRALQRSLLPPEIPPIPGLDLAVAHEVAGEGNEVGGDFYDVFAAGEGCWRFTIGDVCGTGPAAAAVTGLARHTLRILAGEGYDIASVLDRLNRLLIQEVEGTTFITLIHGEIAPVASDGPDANSGADTDGGPNASDPAADAGPGQDAAPAVRLSLVCAGHPLPLLMRAGSGTKPVPAVEPQPLLGIIDELSFTAQDVTLYSGDMVLCVTDGITERREDGRLLDDEDGLASLFADCAGLSAGAVAARIQRAVSEFGTGPPADDMALLVLRAL